VTPSHGGPQTEQFGFTGRHRKANARGKPIPIYADDVEQLFGVLLALTLVVHAPTSLQSAAARIRAIDQQDLADALTAAGLELPLDVHVSLIAEDDPQARALPPWIVGRAFGLREVEIFPARAMRYPYSSLESVTRHEIVHLALTERAGGHPLPRWFHEGVATSVEAGWSITDQLRLLVFSLRDPQIADVSRLFRSDAQPETTLAYLLSTVVIDDLRHRHGAAVPGRIAARVAHGAEFTRAFELECGDTPDASAMHAWGAYRRWTNWIPAVTSGSAVWTLILTLACLAFIVRRTRRARRRRMWDEKEAQ
jgi:hypothetical protein